MGTTPRVLIVGVPPTSGAIYVSRGAGGRGVEGDSGIVMEDVCGDDMRN